MNSLMKFIRHDEYRLYMAVVIFKTLLNCNKHVMMFITYRPLDIMILRNYGYYGVYKVLTYVKMVFIGQML